MGLSVSVVISTFNRLPLLKELLDALARQTLPADRFDVTVVDDGSQRPVAPVLAKRRDPYHLRVLTQKNAGAAAARDAGIRASLGEVIVITDDDMFVPPDFLAQHLAAHEAGYTLVLGYIAPDDRPAEKPLFERFHAEQLRSVEQRYAAHPDSVRGVRACTGNLSFRRADYLDVGGFDRSLGRSEDRDLGLRLQQAGARPYFAKDAVTRNRSDRVDLAEWRQRNFLYGVYDSRIHKKHPEVLDSDPWRFFFLVNPVSRGFLALSALAPRVGKALAGAAYTAADALDRHKAGVPLLERAAIAGTTLSYGLDYFRGVREEAGSVRQVVSDFASQVRTHFAEQRA